MKLALPSFRRVTVSYCGSDVAATALLAAVVGIWAGVAAGAFSVRAWLACEALFFSFYLVGSLIASAERLAAGVLFDLPLRLLSGYAVVNTALFALAWFSPLGVLGDFAVLFALAAAVFFVAEKRRQGAADSAYLWVIAIAVVATTLWCQDSIRPTAPLGEGLVFKPWVDGFYHAVHVRTFAESHGAATIDDFRMAGVPARPYHYAMYMLPAFVTKAAGIHSYAAFAGVLAPVGVLFTGLAAYAFFGSAWGAWPGLAATAALLLLPDGAQQGLKNPFMSYHWLTQISPSATYGLALLVTAWLFVLKACTQGNRTQLLVGWLLALLVVAYKLHYVVASALLLLLIPALFFNGRFSWRQRASWVAAAFAIYGAALAVGQRVPDVPVIRFDGSSVGEIHRLILSFAMPGALHDYAVKHLGPTFPWTQNLLFGIPYVVLTILGLLLPLLVLLLILLRRRLRLLYLAFPPLLLVNFLTMFFGLALDFRSSTPDELSHRPLMIVYFFVVSWIGGACGLLLVESRRFEARARQAIVATAIALLVVPAAFGPGVQRMWAMPRLCPVWVPQSLLRVADYVRARGGPSDLLQDSQFDGTHIIAALSERRPFVAQTLTVVPFHSELAATRTGAVDHLTELRQPKLIRATARAFGIRWFLLEPGDRIDWPPEIADHPTFVAEPFKLYEF